MKIRNKEQAIEAIENDGMSLQYVPKSLRTAELCLEAVKAVKAVKKYGYVIQYVPENLCTAELCFEAVKQSSTLLI